LKRGGEILAGAVSGGITGQRKKKVTWPDMWGPCARERKREKGTNSGCRENGSRPDSVAGPRGSPGPFIYIFFFLSSFFFSVFLFLL
jgi:hypothetical protein